MQKALDMLAAAGTWKNLLSKKKANKYHKNKSQHNGNYCRKVMAFKNGIQKFLAVMRHLSCLSKSETALLNNSQPAIQNYFQRKLFIFFKFFFVHQNQ